MSGDPLIPGFLYMLACRVTLWRPFLVGSGPLLRDFWEVLGSVWEWSGDIFRHSLEGFEKMSDGVHFLFQKWLGVFSLSRGASE